MGEINNIQITRNNLIKFYPGVETVVKNQGILNCSVYK